MSQPPTTTNAAIDKLNNIPEPIAQPRQAANTATDNHNHNQQQEAQPSESTDTTTSNHIHNKAHTRSIIPPRSQRPTRTTPTSTQPTPVHNPQDGGTCATMDGDVLKFLRPADAQPTQTPATSTNARPAHSHHLPPTDDLIISRRRMISDRVEAVLVELADHHRDFVTLIETMRDTRKEFGKTGGVGWS